MGILDELFRRKPEDEFLPEYARPADPLRQLRDAIPENKDGGISMLNMIRSALGTSANWLDGTKDPSAVKVGPDTLAPLGLFGMGGMGVMNAMTRASPDARIGEALARQYPDDMSIRKIPEGSAGRHIKRAETADIYHGMRMPYRDPGIVPDNMNARKIDHGVTIGDMQRHYSPDGLRIGVMGLDDITPLTRVDGMHRPGDSARRAGDATSRAQESIGRPLNDLMADNARSSAPGTVVNSIDPGSSAFHEKVQRRSSYLDAKLQRAEEKKAAWAERRGTSPAPTKPTEPDSIGGHMMVVPRGIAVTDGTAGWRVTDMPRGDNVRDGIRPAATAGKIEPDYPFGMTTRRSNDIFADNAKGSAPGTVVNSIADKPYDVRRAEFEQHIKSGKFASEDDVPVPFQYTRLPPNHEDVVRMDQWSTLPHKKEAVDLSKLWATQKSVDGESVSDMVRGGVKGEPPPPSAYRALDGTIYLVDGHKRMSAAAARGEPTAEAMVVGADNAKGSAPGLAANSTQQPKDASQLSEPMLMELLRKLEGGA